MKKKLGLLALALGCILIFTGCFCDHEWVDANCVSPKTCSLCEKTEGEALGHTWVDPNCVSPKTCSACGQTEGQALGHTWKDATCNDPKTCTVCNATEGEKLGHTWQEATTEAPETCSVCGETHGERIITDARFSSEPAKPLRGKWAGEVAIEGEDLALILGVESVEGRLSYEVSLEFSADGTGEFIMGITDEDGFMSFMLEMSISQFYADMEAQGFDKAASDAAMEQEMGMSVREYMELALAGISASDMEVDEDFVYYVSAGMLYIGSDWDEELYASAFTIEDGVLKTENEWIGMAVELAAVTDNG